MKAREGFRQSISWFYQRWIVSVFWGLVVSPILTRLRLPILEGGFVFLVHPPELEDTYRWLGFLRPLGSRRVRWILHHLWPIVGPPITVGGQVRGRTLFCPWTVKMMIENPVGANAAIKQAAQTARNMGAKWLGTGALTAAMSLLGRDLRGNGMQITTGHAATTILGARILLEALKKTALEPLQATVAVVGAGGNIGGMLAQRLAGQVGRVILIDRPTKPVMRRMQKVADLLEVAGTRTSIHTVDGSTDAYTVLRRADAVFIATSNPEPFVKAEWLRPGAVVVDDSQPVSISKQEAKEHNGVVLQVAAVMPGVDTHFEWPGIGPPAQYTCLAELAALSLNGAKEGVTGPVTLGAAKFVEAELREAGYNRIFQSFGRLISEEDWKRARQAREKTHKEAELLKVEI